MKHIEGLEEIFKESKIVYLVTFGLNDEKHSRPMTNFNENPYETIWFPTYRKTRKVEDIEKNNKVLIIFPDENLDKFYEIEGKAEFASREEVKEKWRWWYLYWHPTMSALFWFDHLVEHEERVIINIQPEAVKILNKYQVEYVSAPYFSIEPKQ